MDVNWYLGDGTLLLSDTSNIAVTQDMVDQGFYVSAWWDPTDWRAETGYYGYEWFFDAGMSFPVSDLGAGDSATPLMSATAMPPTGPADPSDTDFYVFNSIDSAQRYYTDGLGDNGGARTDSVDSLSYVVGDTLVFTGDSGDIYFSYDGDGNYTNYPISTYPLDISWYDGTGAPITGDGQTVEVTQSMVDSGWNVTTSLRSD